MTKPTHLIAAFSLICAACGPDSDSAVGDGDGEGDGDGDGEPLSCNVDGAFLAVDFSGALTDSIAPDESIRCVSVGEPDGLVRGVGLTRVLGDEQWTVEVSGEVELGETGDGIPVEVFVFFGEADSSQSWMGDCALDLEVFDRVKHGGFETYLFGGAVTCAAPLEPFIPGDNETLGVNDLELLGLIFN